VPGSPGLYSIWSI